MDLQPGNQSVLSYKCDMGHVQEAVMETVGQWPDLSEVVWAEEDIGVKV